jgi:hypothetical protein
MNHTEIQSSRQVCLTNADVGFAKKTIYAVFLNLRMCKNSIFA